MRQACQRKISIKSVCRTLDVTQLCSVVTFDLTHSVSLIGCAHSWLATSERNTRPPCSLTARRFPSERASCNTPNAVPKPTQAEPHRTNPDTYERRASIALPLNGEGEGGGDRKSNCGFAAARPPSANTTKPYATTPPNALGVDSEFIYKNQTQPRTTRIAIATRCQRPAR